MNAKSLHSKLIAITIFALFGSSAVAQMDLEDFPMLQKKMEKIEAQKVAFITTKLDLSPAEAQKFWPVYNEFNNKREELQRDFRRKYVIGVDLETMNEEEAAKIGDARIMNLQQIFDLQKSFHYQLKEVLPPKKILRLYEAEQQFKRLLLEKLREKRMER